MLLGSGNRTFVKRTPIPAAKQAAERWIGSIGRATNAPTDTSPLQSRVNYARALGRTSDMDIPQIEGLPEEGLPQESSPEQVDVGVEEYVSVINKLPEELKARPIRTVFTEDSLIDFATKANQKKMVQTFQLVSGAVRGSDTTVSQVEQTATDELTLSMGQANENKNLIMERINRAKKNPFVKVSRNDLADLYDIDPTMGGTYGS